MPLDCIKDILKLHYFSNLDKEADMSDITGHLFNQSPLK